MPTVFPPLTPTKENTMSYFIFLIGLVFRRPFFTNCIILLLCSGVNSIIAFGNFGVGFFLGRGGKTILSPGLGLGCNRPPGLGRLGLSGLGRLGGRLSPGLGRLGGIRLGGRLSPGLGRLGGLGLTLPPVAFKSLIAMLHLRSNLFELV